MQLTQADILAIEREACKRSLATFAKEAWHVLEPATPLKWGWVLDLICAHLEAVSRGESRRLLMNVPPGSMKSLLTGVIWPAYEWGPLGRPDKRFLATAHKEDLAVRDNMKCRRLIQSPWFQERWPLTLTSDQNAKKKFESSATGFREAMAFTSMTGSRGDCLLAGSMVQTESGEIPIENIVNATLSCNVLSYDEHSRKLVYRPIEAVARRSSEHFYRVHLAGGSVVEATGDHRFYTARGYVEARLLSPDDVLLRAVRKADQAQCVSDEKAGEGRASQNDVQQFLQSNSDQSRGRQARPVVQRVWRENPERPAPVFGGVCESRALEAAGLEAAQPAGRAVRGLQQEFPAANSCEEATFLLSPMSVDSTLAGDAWREQSGMAEWGEREALYEPFVAAIPKNQGQDRGAGWRVLRSLLGSNRPMRSSYRHGSGQQCLEEPSDAVPCLPCDLACEGAFQVEREAVALVERVCQPAVVYDIQVGGTRCFFANGVLVHNCVILDDPHSVDDANSRAKLEADLLTFREALPTRVNSDQSAIVIIMQRLNEADVSAAAIALGYDHLCIPMRYEAGRSKWVFGKGDPRTEPGELMFPERFSEAQVVELEQSMGSYAVAGQLQQRPSPRGGGIIRGAWFGQYEALPELEWLAIYADTAQKTGQEHDYSVFELWGRSVTGQAILVDLRRGKWEAPELLAEARSFWLSCRERFGPKLRSMKVEDKVSGTGLIQTLRREGIAVLPVKRNRDKVSRAYDAAPFIESGNVLLPAWTPWLADFVGECEAFPSGANDDQLDPMFDAIHDVQFQRAEKRHGGTYAIPATVTAFSR